MKYRDTEALIMLQTEEFLTFSEVTNMAAWTKGKKRWLDDWLRGKTDTMLEAFQDIFTASFCNCKVVVFTLAKMWGTCKFEKQKLKMMMRDTKLYSTLT